MSARKVKWTTGATAALGGLGAAEAISAVSRGPSLLDSAGNLVVDLGPRPVIDVTVRLLRTADKPVIRATVVGTTVAAGGVLARSLDRSHMRAFVLSSAAGLAAWAGLRRPPRRPGHAVAAAVAGGLAAEAILRAGRSPGRAAATATVAAAALCWARQRLHRHETQFDAAAVELYRPVPVLPPPEDGADSWRGAVQLITPTDEFYTVDVNVATPLVDPNGWRLRMFGAVRQPAQWDLAGLMDMGVEEFDAVMVCIHYQLGWHRVGNARWAGVPLAKLLDRVGPVDGARNLVTRSVDDFAISLPMDLLRQMNAYVVVGMNGGPLPAKHGFPARVFVPGLYGQYTGVKWLTDLEVTAGPYPDYWARRGWPREPVRVRPMSRIDAPANGAVMTGPVTVTGVAWAPPQGLSRVEVSVDDGDWQPAQLAGELAPAAWRRWRHTALLPAGEHRVRTRAAARDGTVQEAMPRPPFPSGVSGYHAVTVSTI